MGGDGLLSYKTLVHAVAGATGGVVAMTVFYPLDTLRHRQQLGMAPTDTHALAALRALAKEEGVSALYKGLRPLLQSLSASNFVYFYAFHGLKTARFRKSKSEAASAAVDLVMAACAGVVNVLLTNPLWVVTTRLRAERRGPAPGVLAYRSLGEGLAWTLRQEGPQSLWAGTGPSLLLVCNPAVQFACYETLKRRLLPDGSSSPSPAVAFALGALAKAFATVMTYPLQLIQAVQRHGGKNVREGLWAMTKRLVAQGGPTALFKGLQAKLLQTVLTAALMFALYERIVAFVLAVLLSHRQHRGAVKL